MDITEQTKKKMESAVDHLKEELKGLRTGRANPGLVEPVIVEAYGSKMRLKELATITAPEPRMLMIVPFDASLAGVIVKAIDAANLNVRADAEGSVVRVKIAEMNSAMREEMVKQVHRKGEEAKISVRNCRRDGNEALKKAKSSGELTEDQIKKGEKKVQEHTDGSCKKIDEMVAEKEKEIQKL